jgi:hypothetical protein
VWQLLLVSVDVTADDKEDAKYALLLTLVEKNSDPNKEVYAIASGLNSVMFIAIRTAMRQ